MSHNHCTAESQYISIIRSKYLCSLVKQLKKSKNDFAWNHLAFRFQEPVTQNRRKWPISNPKLIIPDVYQVWLNASVLTQFIVQKRKLRNDVRQTDGCTEVQRETITPRYYIVPGYENSKMTRKTAIQNYRVNMVDPKDVPKPCLVISYRHSSGVAT